MPQEFPSSPLADPMANDAVSARGDGLSLVGAEGRADDVDAEGCPTIYADEVYLGLARSRRLRVVCLRSA
ncbi:MAG TPA: hypothetical protein VHZ24_01680 [Pirellulales bacterium]|jgi:hypothetical protein|nr:hypothetical protein [Pirellulales bacterium]